jgi:hypothetical protein
MQQQIRMMMLCASITTIIERDVKVQLFSQSIISTATREEGDYLSCALNPDFFILFYFTIRIACDLTLRSPLIHGKHEDDDEDDRLVWNLETMNAFVGIIIP